MHSIESAITLILAVSFPQESSKDHGIMHDGARLDLAQMMKRKDEIVTGLVQSVAALLKKHQIEWIQGTAQLSGPNTIMVDGKGIEASHIF